MAGCGVWVSYRAIYLELFSAKVDLTAKSTPIFYCLCGNRSRYSLPHLFYLQAIGLTDTPWKAKCLKTCMAPLLAGDGLPGHAGDGR